MPELRIVITALALAAAILICAWLAFRRRVGIVLLFLLCLSWLTVDSAWEGPKLLHVSHSHSLTTADLLGLIGMALAIGLAWREVRRERMVRTAQGRSTLDRSHPTRR